MPRTLPWIAGAPNKKQTKHTSTSSPALRRKRASSIEDLVDSDLNAIHGVSPEPKRKKRPNRTPSTSPPPAPPDVEYMREGYDADDIYLMVEDEFLSTAKIFTQHIHHAEYVRLKKLAKSRGTGTLHSIARATDGRIEQSNSLRMKLEAEEGAKKMREGLKSADGDDDSSEAEDAYMLDPQLAGLMTNDMHVRKNLSGLTKARSNTRAAAGFSQSPQNIEKKRDAFVNSKEAFSADTSSKSAKALQDEVYSEVSEDDLDAAPTMPTRPTYAKAEKRQLVATPASEPDSPVRNKTKEISNVLSRSMQSKQDESDSQVIIKPKTSKAVLPSEKVVAQISKNAQTTSNTTHSTAASEYLMKRRVEKERKEREEKRRAKKADEIPTFIF